jgi:hypothetical protein
MAALHLAHHQDPVHNVARMDTGGSTALLCLHKVGQSPIPIPTRLKVSQTSWSWQKTDVALPRTSAPFKITSEEPRVTVQVAGRPQTPTWCYLTSRVSFILHRSPWWGWMVSSQKNLFQFKFLIKVNFKIQVTNGKDVDGY